MTVQTSPMVTEGILNGTQVANLPAEQVRPGHDDVLARTVWRHGHSYAGVLTLEPGAGLPIHSHHLLAHHVWVVRGEAQVLHHRLDPGSYWFIGPGTSHALSAGPHGCSLFFVCAPPG